MFSGGNVSAGVWRLITLQWVDVDNNRSLNVWILFQLCGTL